MIPFSSKCHHMSVHQYGFPRGIILKDFYYYSDVGFGLCEMLLRTFLLFLLDFHLVKLMLV